MANKTLQIGIIGRHFGSNVHAAAFRLSNRCDVVANASRDWHSIVENPEIDAISIAVPPKAQTEIARRALELKKHVLMEKPATADRKAAADLLELAQKNHVTAMIDFELPFMKTWIEAKKKLDDGEIGRLENVQITWKTLSFSKGEYDSSWKFNAADGGGMLSNFGSHVFNYVEHFFGRAQSLRCERQFVTHSGNIKLDVAVDLTMLTRTKVPITVKMDGRGAKPLHRIEITGNRGTLTLENMGSDYVSGFILKKGRDVVATEKHASEHGDGRIWAVHQVINRFLESAETGKLNAPSLYDAVRSEELIELAAKSNTIGQEVPAL